MLPCSCLCRFLTCIYTTPSCCWPTPSTRSWRTESGTAWPASPASGRTRNPGKEDGPCWKPSRRYLFPLGCQNTTSVGLVVFRFVFFYVIMNVFEVKLMRFFFTRTAKLVEFSGMNNILLRKMAQVRKVKQINLLFYL